MSQRSSAFVIDTTLCIRSSVFVKAAAFTRTIEVFGFIPCGPMSRIREREAITDQTSFKECDQKSTLLA